VDGSCDQDAQTPALIRFVAEGNCTLTASSNGVTSAANWIVVVAGALHFTAYAGPNPAVISATAAYTPVTDSAATLTSTDTAVCTIAANGAVTFKKAGVCVIHAAGQNGGTADLSITVGVRITSTPASASQLVGSTYTAVADSAGSVFSIATGGTAGACSVNAATGLVTFLAAGTCKIQATSGGQVSVAQSIAVAVGSVTMSLAAGANSTNGAVVDAQYTVTTSVSATVTSLTPTVCTVVGVNATTSIVTFLAVGDCTLKAVAANGGTNTDTIRVGSLDSSSGPAAGDDSSSSTGETISAVAGSRDAVSVVVIAALVALVAAVMRQA
jgi:alpha-amylase